MDFSRGALSGKESVQLARVQALFGAWFAVARAARRTDDITRSSLSVGFNWKIYVAPRCA